MRLKAFLNLLILPTAISLFSSSCITVDKTLGEKNIPSDNILSLGTARFHLPLQTKIADSLQALNSSYGYIGAIRTEELGLAQFSCATNFAPQVSDDDYGKDPVVKKIYIAMSLSGNTLVDETQEGITQNFHVYRTNRYVDTTDKYNNTFKTSDYNHTPINQGSTIFTGGDSLNIYLKNSFGEELLKATENQLDSAIHFVKAFKGLYFTCDAPIAGANGGRLNRFSVSSSFIYMTINFEPTWGTDHKRKDTTIVYALGVDYAQNISSYESKALQSTAPQEYIDVEGIGGLKPYINPLTLKDTLDKWMNKMGYDSDKVLISNATYYLPFELPSNIKRVASYYPQYLFPSNRVVDTTDYYYYPISDVYSSSNSVGIINRSKNWYSGQITKVIQKLISSEKADIAAEPEYKMWFFPVSSSSNSYYSTTSYSIDMSGYTLGRINGPLNSNYPYIEIVYAILK